MSIRLPTRAALAAVLAFLAAAVAVPWRCGTSPGGAAAGSAEESAGREARRPAPPPIAGVVLPMHGKEPGRSYARELAEIRALGAGWVELIVVTRQARVDSVEIPHVSDRTPPFEDVEAAVRDARAAGLRVLLTPVVLIRDPGPEDWRGTLRPTDRAAWFESYGAFVLRLARLAARAEAEAFCVGSELASLEEETARWRALIADVRAVFDGWLTYSANWDHFEELEFWPELDFASMTAYFVLSGRDEPSVSDLARGWRAAEKELRRLRERAGLPVVFSEVGLPSQQGAAKTPWDYTRRAPVDLDLQRRAFEAFEAVFAPEGRRIDELHGLFLYDWWGEGGEGSGTYTARGKPAAEVWERVLRAVSGPE